MPYSSAEGKDFVRAFFTLEKRVNSVLDIGPGAGVYYDLLHPYVAADYWCAVEIWAPYIEQFKLREKYDEVVIADVDWFDWDAAGSFDLVIFGDVLEHMPRSSAERAIARAIGHARYVVISIPITHYPQGAEMGNPFEAHVTSWTDESVREDLLDGYEILDSYVGDVVGVYIVKGAQLV